MEQRRNSGWRGPARRLLFVLLAITSLAIVGCGHPPGENHPSEGANAKAGPAARPVYQNVADSLAAIHIDTSTVKGKRQYIMNQFLIEWGGLGPEYDTLLDLNFDGVDDYAIGWYGLAGNGLKHNWNVHMWHPGLKAYLEDTNLTGKPNPSFFPNDSLITSFYITYGGGSGEQWKWRNGEWQQTMSFHVENKEDKSDWLLTFPATGTKKTIRHPYQGIPPTSVLKTLYLRSPIDE